MTGPTDIITGPTIGGGRTTAVHRTTMTTTTSKKRRKINRNEWSSECDRKMNNYSLFIEWWRCEADARDANDIDKMPYHVDTATRCKGYYYVFRINIFTKRIASARDASQWAKSFFFFHCPVLRNKRYAFFFFFDDVHYWTLALVGELCFIIICYFFRGSHSIRIAENYSLVHRSRFCNFQKCRKKWNEMTIATISCLLSTIICPAFAKLFLQKM